MVSDEMVLVKTYWMTMKGIEREKVGEGRKERKEGRWNILRNLVNSISTSANQHCSLDDSHCERSVVLVCAVKQVR